jgi:spore germination protein GerM
MSDYNKFEEGLKLVVLYQATLEQMDNFKNTKLYKQSIKKNMNRLEKDIEQLIHGPIAQLDKINSDLFTDIQGKVELILDLSATELAQLKLVVDDHREKQLQEWQQQILDKEIEGEL